jgi:hypothetical protein
MQSKFAKKCSNRNMLAAITERCTVMLVKPAKRTGNWTPDGKAERAALRRDYEELTPAQRMEQVFELSRFMSRVVEAGADSVHVREINVDKHLLHSGAPPPNESLVDWLLACPEKGYFTAIESEPTATP